MDCLLISAGPMRV